MRKALEEAQQEFNKNKFWTDLFISVNNREPKSKSELEKFIKEQLNQNPEAYAS